MNLSGHFILHSSYDFGNYHEKFVSLNLIRVMLQYLSLTARYCSAWSSSFLDQGSVFRPSFCDVCSDYLRFHAYKRMES